MNTAKPQHDIVRRTDPKTGTEEVGVRLKNRRDLRAWTTLDAYERIVAAHGHAAWFLNDNGQGRAYVRLTPGTTGQPFMVSRLVTGHPPRKVIKHHDGDRLNLRPGNLMVCERRPHVAAAQGGVRVTVFDPFESHSDVCARRTGFTPSADEQHWISIGFTPARIIEVLHATADAEWQRERLAALTAWREVWREGFDALDAMYAVKG